MINNFLNNFATLLSEIICDIYCISQNEQHSIEITFFIDLRG